MNRVKKILFIMYVLCLGLIVVACSSDGEDSSSLSVSLSLMRGVGDEVLFDYSNYDKAEIVYLENSCGAELSENIDGLYVLRLKNEGIVDFYFNLIKYLRTTKDGNEIISENESTSIRIKYTVKSYQNISTVDELNSITAIGAYKLVDNINMSGKLFNMIPEFKGVINGNGYSITNLTLQADYYSNIGFIRINKGVVSNLRLENSYIVTEKTVSNMGLIAGVNYGEIANCYTSGEVYSANAESVGGLAGSNYGTVFNCVNEANIKAKNNVGGAIGYNYKSSDTNPATFGNLKNLAKISGTENIGGIIGRTINESAYTYSGLENYGDVVGNSYVGGAIGRTAGKGEQTYVSFANHGTINGRNCVGGLFGLSDGTVRSCVNYGIVLGTVYTGGIAGHGINFDKCENLGDVIIYYITYGVDTNVGGIAGNAKTVSNSTNSGDISYKNLIAYQGVVNVGGIAGTAEKLTGNNNSGSIKGGVYVGGIVGFYDKETAVSDCVNNGEVSGVSYVGGVSGAGKEHKLCENNGAITASSSNVGGISGSATKIADCKNTANISGKINTGGLCGVGTEIINGNNSGAISGTNYVGGVSGKATAITSSENNGVISGVFSVGGIAGLCESVSSTANNGNVTGMATDGTSEYVGGIAGQISTTSTTLRNENNTNNGRVSGDGYVGGIAGLVNNGTFISCINFGVVTASGRVAGGVFAVIEKATSILQCVNRVSVSSQNVAGGVVAVRESTVLESIIANCLNYGSVNISTANGIKTEILGTAYYKITYNFNSATGNNNKTFDIVFLNSDYQLVVPIRTGYTFGGWFELSGDNEIFYTDEYGVGLDIWTFTEGKTLQAKWVASISSVMLNANQGEMPLDSELSHEITYDSAFDLPVPTREGYTFLGWYLNESQITGSDGEVSQWKTIGNCSLEAQWEALVFIISTINPDVSYTVRFDLNGGDGVAPASQSISATKGLVFPDAPTRDGYKFLAWYDNTDGTGEPFDFSANINENKTLFAKWHSIITDILPNENYNYTLNMYSTLRCQFISPVTQEIRINTGTGMSLIYLFRGRYAAYWPSDNPSSERLAYQYKGYFTFTATAGQIYTLYIMSDGYSTVNPTLVFESMNYPQSGGLAEIVECDYEITYDSNYIIPPKEKEGFTFIGWFTEENGGGMQYTNNLGESLNTFVDITDIMLYAYYEPVL